MSSYHRSTSHKRRTKKRPYLQVLLIQELLLYRCNGLSSMKLSTSSHYISTHHPKSSSFSWPTHSSHLCFNSQTTMEDEKSSNRPPNNKPDVTPFNHDIARTLFAPLFFSRYYDKNNNNNNSEEGEQSTSASIRHHYQRPSPFEDPSCAQTAERMLRRMMENRLRSDGRTVCPDRRSFSLVSAAFGRLRCKRGQRMVTWEEESRQVVGGGGQYNKRKLTPVDKLQQLLHLQLQLCHREGWSEDIVPSVDMYNRILKRLAWQSGSYRSQQEHVDGGVSAAEQAWLWLQLMQSLLPPNDITDEENKVLCQPNAITYSHVISALSSYRKPVPSRKMNTNSLISRATIPEVYESIETLAERIDIEIIASEKPQSSKQLTSEWFLTEAEALLAMIEDEYNTATPYMKDNEVGLSKDKVKSALVNAYANLCKGWGRYAVTGGTQRRGDRATKRAHEILSRLEELTSDEVNLHIPSSCYSSVILAYSTSNILSASADAEDVLQRMMSHYGINDPSCFDQSLLSSTFFDVNDVSTAFSGCIAAHSKNNDAPNAEVILNQMIDLYDDGILGADFVPEQRAFGSCIALWGKYDGSKDIREQMKKGRDLPSRRQRIENADRAENILSELERVAEREANKGNKKFVLQATPYNIAILARVQTIKRDKHNKDDKKENERIILHAQSLLDHMEFTMGVSPDPYTYSTLLHAWCQQSAPGNEIAADYAEDLLRRRIEDVDISRMDYKRSRETHQNEIWPNVKHFSSVLKAHARTKSAEGARKALGLLSEMEARFYDASILDDTDTGDENEYHIDQKDVAKPDLVCYSIVIDAFANSRLQEASSVALRLLNAVETKYEQGDISMKPNTRIYTAAILSLVHSPIVEDGHNNNAQQAWSILERMKKNDAPPNSFTFNYIINCAAQTGNDNVDHKMSFEIALRAFQALRKASNEADAGENNCGSADKCHPDSFTFAFMIKACNNLLPPGTLRTKVISMTFREACGAGYLNDAILDRLWVSCSAKEFYNLLDEKPRRSGYQNKSPIQVDDLPSAWSCNSIKKFSSRRSNKGDAWKKEANFNS